MISQQIAVRYATALFNLVRERGMMDQAQEQFEILDGLIETNPALIQFLLAPHIPGRKKAAMINTVFGSRLESLFVRFLIHLFEKNRIGYLHEIIIVLLKRIDQERGIVVSRVITAIPLVDDERRELIARLQAKTGKMITLDEQVDPSILGGMIVIVKDQIIDGSVRRQLSLLKEELMKLKVA